MRALVVKLTFGVEAPERANQAFTVAASALAAGSPVSLWLTGEASWFAVPGRVEEFSLPHATPLADLRDALAPAGALWVLRPKGCGAITESDVMAAGKAAGLVDVKVVRFSETHTAEKFVIPVSKRP